MALSIWDNQLSHNSKSNSNSKNGRKKNLIEKSIRFGQFQNFPPSILKHEAKLNKK